MFMTGHYECEHWMKEWYCHSVTKNFFFKNRKKPQLIGCQHNVLDRVLRIVMDEELGGNNKSPNIEYPIIPELVKNYQQLRMNFKNVKEMITRAAGWRKRLRRN